MSDSSVERNPVEVLADEFLARQRRGERPSLGEYVARYPELAVEIQELFPVLLDMEDARLDAAELPGPAAGVGEHAPRNLGDYRILREIGRGGMAVVYEAEQESLGRRVALKVLARTALTSQQIRRFEREARSAGRLHHTNIVPVFGVGHAGNVHYYVMQYIPGQPLDQVIKEVRRLRRGHHPRGRGLTGASAAGAVERPSAGEVALSLWSGRGTPPAIERGPEERVIPDSRTTDVTVPDRTALNDALTPDPRVNLAGAAIPSSSDADVFTSSVDLTGSGSRYARAIARIGVQVADALEYAAVQGIIHRDVKPSNILLDLHGTAWVTDFGLAKVTGLEDLTQSGDLVGTLRYMAPERFRGEADRRSDLYALGLTLYELLVLRPAHNEADRVRLVRQVTDEEAPRLSKLDPTIPWDLATIVHKAMAREPTERYATAAEMAADLRRFLEDRPIAARRPSLLDRGLKLSRRYRSAVIAGAIGLVLALAILAASLGWILRDRGARLELTEREVTRAVLEAATFQARAKWPEALEAVKRAEGLLAVGGSEQLHQRVRERRHDVDMVIRLEEIRQPHSVNAIERAPEKLGWDAEYSAAFREYGIDVLALDPVGAGVLIRARSIQRELTAGVDHWVEQCKRHRSSDEARWKRLIAVARAADPDEWRNRLRGALEQGDRATANKLAESAAIDELPVQTLELLLPQLDKSHQLPVLRRAQRQHPGDYWINFKLAYGLDYEPPPLQDQDEAIRFYTAAIACRPRNAPGHYYLAHVLYQRGRVDEAIAAYQKAIELDPDYTSPRAGLCAIYFKQGKLDLAVAECQKAIERNARDAEAHDLLGQALGMCSRTAEAIREYERAVALKPNVAEFQNNLAWILVTSPEKRLRNPSRALELAKSAVAQAENVAPCWNTLGVALYRVEDWNGAMGALEKSIALQGYTSFDGFFLAMAHAQLGKRDEAKRQYDKALRWMQTSQPNDKELRRFGAEAAELLGIDTAREPSKSAGPR